MDDETKPDPRAVWLRSLGWHESAQGLWSGEVAAARFGRYAPMPIDHAYDAWRSGAASSSGASASRSAMAASGWRRPSGLAVEDLAQLDDANEAR